MDLGRSPEARFTDRTCASPRSRSPTGLDMCWPWWGVTADNRAGIERTLHRIRASVTEGQIIGLTLRVGGGVRGMELVRTAGDRQESPHPGRPGSARHQAAGDGPRPGRRFSQAGHRHRHLQRDCRRRDIPHPGIGTARRMQVRSRPAARDHDRGGGEPYAGSDHRRRNRTEAEPPPPAPLPSGGAADRHRHGEPWRI